jgi:hypothetical protein
MGGAAFFLRGPDFRRESGLPGAGLSVEKML